MEQTEWTQEVEEALVEEHERSAPWSILNTRDSKEVVIKFLEGFSPSAIAPLVNRSLPYVYSVLRSQEAQQAITEFDQERERGLLDVHRRLDVASVHLLDGLLKIAYTGKNEGVRLKAIIEGLGMSGVSKIQKVQSLTARVMVPMEKLHLAQQTIDMENQASGNGGGDNGGGSNGVLDRKSLLQSVITSLTARGSEGAIVPHSETGGGPEARLENEVPTEPLLPSPSRSGIRQADGLPAPPVMYAAPASGPATPVGGVASGTLQEHHREQGISDVASGERSVPENPYYKRDGDERTEVAL